MAYPLSSTPSGLNASSICPYAESRSLAEATRRPIACCSPRSCDIKPVATGPQELPTGESLQTEAPVVDALGHLPNPCFRDEETSTAHSHFQKPAQFGESVPHGGHEAPFNTVDAVQHLALRLDDDLGRSARCRRSDVGNQVGDREIDLMTDGGDDRMWAPRDGARHAFLVERPEIFDRPSAPCDDDDIDIGAAKVVDPLDKLGRRPIALDLGRVDQDVDRVVPPVENRKNIPKGRTSRGRDDTDARRESGQGTLARRGEQAFPVQLFLEPFEGRLQCPAACPARAPRR